MRTARNLSWLIVLTVALTGCPTTPTQPPAQDFGFALGDTVFAAVPGTSITTSAVITPINGFDGSVALSIANQDSTPADPGITLNPNTITISSNAIAQQSVQQQILIDVAITVVNDTFDLRITATSGNLSSTADLTLTVADTLQPQVTITSPNSGDTFTGTREVTLTGNLSAVSEIANLSASGVQNVVSTIFDQTSFTITVELANNQNQVIVTAEDSQGRLGSSSPVRLDFPFLDLADFQPATVVIGQPSFRISSANQGGIGANTLNFPFGNPFVTDTGTLFLPDSSNNRVLGFNQVPTSNDASADFVLGQPDFTTDTSGTSATTLFFPFSVHSDGTKLAVADNFNNRVLIWNTIPTTTPAAADVVVGQPDFVTNTSACDDSTLSPPASAIITAGKLIVAEFFNNRVLSTSHGYL